MATITNLTPQKRNKNRVNIYIDEEFFTGADAFTVLKARIKVGQEVNAEQLRSVVLESEIATAFEKAAKLLISRLKSEQEAEQYLSGKGFAPEVVSATLEKLKEHRLLDNAYYAKNYVGHYSATSGKRSIKYGLRKKGVDEDTIEDALCELSEEEETASCRRVAEKYMRGKQPSIENKAKLYRHLLGKGFSYDIVSKVVGESEE